MRTVKRLILFLIIPLLFIADYAKASSAKPGG